MTPENEEKLFAIEPSWFDRTSMQRSLMCFGFECGDGWFGLVERLLLEAKARGFTAPEFEVAQVKEKLGGLRFHFDGGDAAFRARVSAAEDVSFAVCEVCGQPGVLRGGGYLRTLCDVHAAQRRKGAI